ncbi:MAG: hypothetical protein GY759_08020 [Chloroflexi bacterium]|nr:hypothetical protein [Chloroflexota bacterium]
MKLTRRQETFIRTMLDLYLVAKGPIHYSTVAERMEVSRITAYDMLRLLEEKGYIRSEYQRSGEKSSPGRAEIVFWPTDLARQRFEMMAQGAESGDFEAIKDRLLQQIQEEVVPHGADPQFAEEMLARIPPDGPPAIRYCVEVITILSLRLQKRSRKILFDTLPAMLPLDETPSAIELNLFSGFVLGLQMPANSGTPQWNTELLEHVKQCQKFTVGMTAEQRHSLAANLCQALKPLAELNHEMGGTFDTAGHKSDSSKIKQGAVNA